MIQQKLLSATPLSACHRVDYSAGVCIPQDGAGPSSMDVQASILVLHDPEAQAITVPNVAPAAASAPRKQAPKRVAARPVLMPNSTWNAMSALAGALLLLCPSVKSSGTLQGTTTTVVLDQQMLEASCVAEGLLLPESAALSEQ